MDLVWHIPHDPRHDAGVAGFTSGRNDRIGRYTVEGETFWIKRVDQPRLVNRLQKGPPDKVFAADLAALKAVAARGGPVTEIVADGPGIFVCRDGGPTLEHILRQGVGTKTDRIEAFRAAGAALAAMHRAGVSHGRPLLRDICWKDGRITFLDFENYRPERNRLKDFRFDLVAFVHSCHAQTRQPVPEIEAAIAAYRAHDPGGVWEAAQNWIWRVRIADLLTRPLQWRADPHAREYKALPATVRAFAR